MQIPSSTFSSNSHKNKQQSSHTYQRPIELMDIPKKHNPVSNCPTYPFLKLTDSSHLKMDGVGIQSFPRFRIWGWPGLFSGAKLLLLVSGNFHVMQPLKLCRSFQGKHSKLTWFFRWRTFWALSEVKLPKVWSI